LLLVINPFHLKFAIYFININPTLYDLSLRKIGKKAITTNFKLFWIAIRYRPTSLLNLLKDFSDTSLDCFRLSASSSPLLPNQEDHNCFGWLTGSISPRLFIFNSIILSRLLLSTYYSFEIVIMSPANYPSPHLLSIAERPSTENFPFSSAFFHSHTILSSHPTATTIH
jgi:hypothetical protein